MSKTFDITAYCDRIFAKHKATLIQDTDRYFAIDWRREDGSGDCYVNYIVDKQRGSLIISGDLGDCIATWYSPFEISRLKTLIADIDYFISKFQCSSDKYTYDEDDIFDDIKNYLETNYDILNYWINKGENADDIDIFWDSIKENIEDSITGKEFLPSDTLLDMICDIDDYDIWAIHKCGERIAKRVYLWQAGFIKACKQLDI